jgi:CheY-like chemotaxis protein
MPLTLKNTTLSMDGSMNQEVHPKNLKVLMADDNELNRLLVVNICKKIGWELDVVENGLMVLEKLKSSHYDLILMDIQMPEMNGLEATRKIRNEFAPPLNAIPIIACTAYGQEEEIKECLTAGMNDYIAKPFKLHDFLAKVNLVL